MFAAIINFFKSIFNRKEESQKVELPVAQKPKSKPDYFNEYILKSVDYLYKNYPNLGYNLKYAYSHEVPYGPNGSYGKLKPTGKKSEDKDEDTYG